jgi:hypothetical protein
MRLGLLLIFICCTIAACAQTTLKFCVLVDSTGKCTKTTTEFDVSKDGGTISLLLKNDKAFNTTKVSYRIFFIDAMGNEKLTNTVDQIIQKEWTYAWQDIVFYDAGMYKVKVYNTDGEDTFVCSEVLKIFTR